MRAFSLIELMVILSVVGLLSSIAVPQYENYRKRAIVGEAINLAKQYSTAAVINYNTRGIFYPGALGSNGLDNITGPDLCSAGCGIDPAVERMRLVYSTTAAEPTFQVAIEFSTGFAEDTFRRRISLITKLTDEGLSEVMCGVRSNRNLNANYLPTNCRTEVSLFFIN